MSPEAPLSQTRFVMNGKPKISVYLYLTWCVRWVQVCHFSDEIISSLGLDPSFVRTDHAPVEACGAPA